MTSKFSKEFLKISIIAGLMLLLGILFIALPQGSFNVLVTILGWCLIVVGVAMVISYFALLRTITTSIQFVTGMLLFFFGLLFLTVPTIYIALIGFGLALFGIQYVGEAILRQKLGDKGWWKDLIFGLVEFLIGAVLVILRYSSVAQNAIMIYLGIALILDAIFLICTVFVWKRSIKQVGGFTVEVNAGKEIKENRTVKTTTAKKVKDDFEKENEKTESQKSETKKSDTKKADEKKSETKKADK